MKVSVKTAEAAPVGSPPYVVFGGGTSRALLTGDKNPIHTHLYSLPKGAALSIRGSAQDLLLYVWKGAVTAFDTALAAGSSAVVEHLSVFDCITGEDGASVVAFGVSDDSPRPEGEGGRVHLLPNRLVPRTDTVNGQPMEAGLHADAVCPTPHVWLHENGFSGADQVVDVHSHSEDEVIFVTEGQIRLGRKLFGPGTAIAVKADTKYGFSAGPKGMKFVNFRGGPPTYTRADGSQVVDEGKFWRDLFGSPPYRAFSSP